MILGENPGSIIMHSCAWDDSVSTQQFVSKSPSTKRSISTITPILFQIHLPGKNVTGTWVFHA